MLATETPFVFKSDYWERHFYFLQRLQKAGHILQIDNNGVVDMFAPCGPRCVKCNETWNSENYYKGLITIKPCEVTNVTQ